VRRGDIPKRPGCHLRPCAPARQSHPTRARSSASTSSDPAAADLQSGRNIPNNRTVIAAEETATVVSRQRAVPDHGAVPAQAVGMAPLATSKQSAFRRWRFSGCRVARSGCAAARSRRMGLPRWRARRMTAWSFGMSPPAHPRRRLRKHKDALTLVRLRKWKDGAFRLDGYELIVWNGASEECFDGWRGMRASCSVARCPLMAPLLSQARRQRHSSCGTPTPARSVIA
jgi:hypothetical protein